MNHSDADEYVDHIWDGQGEERLIYDCRVIRRNGSYAIRITYDFFGEARMRTFVTSESLEGFLHELFDDAYVYSREVESWDADIGL